MGKYQYYQANNDKYIYLILIEHHDNGVDAYISPPGILPIDEIIVDDDTSINIEELPRKAEKLFEQSFDRHVWAKIRMNEQMNIKEIQYGSLLTEEVESIADIIGTNKKTNTTFDQSISEALRNLSEF